MFNEPVRVIANPKTGKVYTPNAAGTHMTVAVEQYKSTSNRNYLGMQHRVAFLRGENKVMERYNLKAGQILPGTIYSVESFEPQYEEQQPKMNPKTGEIVLTEGRPTYLQYFHSFDVNQPDIFIRETANVAEEKAVEKEALQEI